MKYIVTLNGKKYEVDVTDTTAEVLSITDNTAQTQQKVEPTPAKISESVQTVAELGTKVVAPMHGNILKLNVAIGQEVKADDVLIVLEAMKMENDIKAPCDGIVADIKVNSGDTVSVDDVLVVIS